MSVVKQVVCINDDWKPKGGNQPIKGHVYTIRGIWRSKCGSFIGYWLHEITNTHTELFDGSFGEQSHITEYFRPVRDTSIEIFREIVRTAPRELETVDG